MVKYPMGQVIDQTYREVLTSVENYLLKAEQASICLNIFDNNHSWKIKDGTATFKFLDYDPRTLLCMSINRDINFIYDSIKTARSTYMDLMRVEFGSISPDDYKLLQDKFRDTSNLSAKEMIIYINDRFYELELILKEMLVPLSVATEVTTWTKNVDGGVQFYVPQLRPSNLFLSN